MKPEEIITLINAGYTKAEIQAMEQPAPDPEPIAPAPAPKPEQPAPEPEPDQEQPAPEPEQPALKNNSTDEIAKYITALTAQVSSLTKQIQRSNLLNAQQPPAPEADSAEKILASIITPKH